jgi:AAA family ATP:ADP antiporter
MRLLRRVVDVRPEEVRATLWSFAYFLFLLTAYYILRPIRDERGVFVGSAFLPRLYGFTFAGMLLVVPLWSALVARVPRVRLLPWVYRFFVANLLVFFALFRLGVAERVTAQVFFVWLSVFNFFAVAVFWGLMADVFTHAQGKRLFGFIAAGGSAGALLGPVLTKLLVRGLGAAALVLISAVLLELVARCVTGVVRARRAAGAGASEVVREVAKPVGGTAFSGIAVVFGSAYLGAIALYTLLAAMAGTWGYNLQARLVEAAGMTQAERIDLFATLDLGVNVLSVVVQAVVVGRLLARFGAGTVLMLIPPLSSISFAFLAVRPVLAVASTLQVLRRTLAYALWQPAGNVLFTVVEPEQKYKSKAFIELVVYRGGDFLTSALVAWLLARGAGVGGAALAAIPVGVVWFGVAVWLARQHARKAGVESPASHGL